jgi:hypothetical protein
MQGLLKIINWIKGLFSSLPITKQVVWSNPSDGGVSYTILYVNGLSPSQIGIILNHSIVNFSPSCKPFRCMVGGSGIRYEFPSPCMGGEELKRIVDKTFSDSYSPIPVIKSILCDGIQIYPLQYKTK